MKIEVKSFVVFSQRCDNLEFHIFEDMAIVAIPSDSDFTLDNLPYGVFSTKPDNTARIGVAIGEHILDLKKVATLFDGPLMKDQQVGWVLHLK